MRVLNLFKILIKWWKYVFFFLLTALLIKIFAMLDFDLNTPPDFELPDGLEQPD